MNELRDFVVHYRHLDSNDDDMLQSFMVQAEDMEHAIEQTMNAYGAVIIIRVYVDCESLPDNCFLKST